MKFSVNWLREFVDLPAKIEDLTELLTMAGVEIEGIEQHGANVDKVVVAQIRESVQHPNADRLSVCQVDDGSGHIRQIVCGAKNYKAGDKVLLAQPGAALPNGLKIKESKLRGVESQGMLCSPIELGLGQDSSGLLILSPEARIGAPIGELFPGDTILDVEITPNRGDLLSHYGLAREIAALSSRPLKEPESLKHAGATSLPRSSDGVEMCGLTQCPFFSIRRIDNVTVAPSPTWLSARLEAVGIRAINNIVDISNFVMLELGQPTHAFDAAKLKGGIIVRPAHDGEKFLALDGRNYSLTARDLAIADQERAVGIGGVMGGEETGVSATTKSVLLEAAYFQPATIRRTARELSLPSDASYRFERGVDPQMILRASNRAAELIAEIAGGKPAGEIVIGGELPADPKPVTLRYEVCNRLAGVEIPAKTADAILTHFGLSRENSDANSATFRIPSFRRDLQRDVDLIEEIVRAYGVQKIDGTDRSRFTPTRQADISHDLDSALCDRLVGRGLFEARTSKLVSRQPIAFGENAVSLRNPLSEDHVALRPSLVLGLLGALERNVRAGADRVCLFEIGRVFLAPEGREEKRVGILLWGNAQNTPHWRSRSTRNLDFIDLKGVLETVAPGTLSLRKTEHADLSLATEVLLNQKSIGLAGQLAGARTSSLGVTGGILVAELNWEALSRNESSARVFREIDRFPAVTRDIALIVPENASNEEILRVIRTPAEPLLESIQLFDLFSGSEASNLGAARKSLAYRLTYRDKNRTLTSEEVSAVHAKIRERLQNEFGAELRE